MPISKLSKYFFSSHALWVYGAFLFLSASLINLKNEKPILELSKQDTALNINNNLLLYASAGNRRLLTDLIYIQTLIESDVEHYRARDLNSWLFLRFNSVATLDPKFYENYLYGGQFLAIVKDDLEGADYLYDKGLAVYPDDYALNYGSGFLNYYELGNSEKGLKHLEKVKYHPKAPVFLVSIINKLRLETGTNLEEVFKLVLHDYETTRDETLKKRLRADLYALKAEIDLTCLNNEKSACDYLDLDGKAYIKRGETYHSPKLFVPYRIKRREAQKLPSENKPIDTIK